MVAAGHDDVGHQQRVGEEHGLERLPGHQQGQGPREDRGEADVHGRHGGDGVEEGIVGVAEQCVVPCDRRRPVEAELTEEAGRRNRIEPVGQHREAHGGDDRVAHEAVAAPVEEEDHDQGQDAALEVHVRVAPARQLRRPRVVLGPGLHVGLDQGPDRVLERDQVARARERGGEVARFREAAQVAPGRVGRSDHEELDQQVERTAGQQAPPQLGEAQGRRDGRPRPLT